MWHNNQRYNLLWDMKEVTARKKKSGLLTSSIVFEHDNALPHTAGVTTTLLYSSRWEQFCQPSYSANLTPSNFSLFSHLKKFLASFYQAKRPELVQVADGRMLRFGYVPISAKI
ncbi:hypothetical protein CDAR_209941 [Caerostris darwini]|uniref:Transposase n=1 Tax=Caerostris darwini TaxID=1538125 RepID=A0AAV4QFP5_9ARAC|nr:hypothetical protein CDAR_209941 [Caerostris darwini]